MGVPFVGVDYGAPDGDRAAYAFRGNLKMEDGDWEKLNDYFFDTVNDDAADAARYAHPIDQGTFSNRLNDTLDSIKEEMYRLTEAMADPVYQAGQRARPGESNAARGDREARARLRAHNARRQDEFRGVTRVPVSLHANGTGANHKPVIDVEAVCSACKGAGVDLREMSFVEVEKLGVDATWVMCKDCRGVMPPTRRSR